MAITERGEYSLKGKTTYAFLTKTDKFHKYRLDLCLTDPKELEKAKDLGLTIKQPTPGGRHVAPYVSMSRKTKDDKGNDIIDKVTRKVVGPIDAVDPQGNHVSDFLGDGTEVDVRFAAGPFVWKGKFGIYASPLEVTVLKLIPYKKAS